jgi:hypothetical protein
MTTTYNLCHGCQERYVDCENKRSHAFFPLHRAGVVQKSLKRSDLRARIGRSRNRGRGAFPRASQKISCVFPPPPCRTGTKIVEEAGSVSAHRKIAKSWARRFPSRRSHKFSSWFRTRQPDWNTLTRNVTLFFFSTQKRNTKRTLFLGLSAYQPGKLELNAQFQYKIITSQTSRWVLNK